MNKRTHILAGVLTAAAVLLLGAASTKTGLSAWKTQVGVQAALSLQDGRQLALQEAALTVYRPAVQAAEDAGQAPAQTPETNAAEEPAATPDNALEPAASAAPEPTTPEPTETALPEDAPPAEETGSETGTGEAAADAQAQPQALAAPMNAESNAESTVPEAEAVGEAEAEPAEPQAEEPAAPELSELEPAANGAQPEPTPAEPAQQSAPAPQAAAPEGTPVEVRQPEGLCAEYPEVALQPGGWAEYQVILVNEGAVDAALPELEIPDLPEGVSCEGPELPESGLLRAGEGWTLTWIVHCEGESRTVAFSVTARLTQPPIAPAPSAAYTIAPGSGREEETP